MSIKHQPLIHRGQVIARARLANLQRARGFVVSAAATVPLTSGRASVISGTRKKILAFPTAPGLEPWGFRKDLNSHEGAQVPLYLQWARHF